MVKVYWNDALLVLAALLPLVHPINPNIQAAIILALAAYGAYVKFKAS